MTRDRKSVFWELLDRYDRTKAASKAARRVYEVDPGGMPLSELHRLEVLHEAAWQAVDAILDRLADLEVYDAEVYPPIPVTVHAPPCAPPQNDARSLRPVPEKSSARLG